MEDDTSSFLSIIPAASIAAIAVALIAPPRPFVPAAPQTADVRLAADSVPLGAIPAAFIRNQLTFCGLMCPSIVQLATTVPAGPAKAPLAFVGGLQSGSLLRAFGAAAESVTSPADTATAGIINPDVFIVVPNAIGTTADRRGLGVHRGGGAGPTGSVHTANVTATELANTGNPGEAVRAGATAANNVIGQARGIVTDAVGKARGIVTDAVGKAASDVRASLHQPRALTAASSVRVGTPGVVKAAPVKSVAHHLSDAVHHLTNGGETAGRR